MKIIKIKMFLLICVALIFMQGNTAHAKDLENGEVIPCFMGDVKSDVHTDDSNLFTIVGKYRCCSEFIVDMNKLDKQVKKMGNCSYNENWDSPVSQIIY